VRGGGLVAGEILRERDVPERSLPKAAPSGHVASEKHVKNRAITVQGGVTRGGVSEALLEARECRLAWKNAGQASRRG